MKNINKEQLHLPYIPNLFQNTRTRVESCPLDSTRLTIYPYDLGSYCSSHTADNQPNQIQVE